MLEVRDEKADDQRLFMIKQWGFTDPGPLIDADIKNYQLALDQGWKNSELKTNVKCFCTLCITTMVNEVT
jgi:hypothetical protein